MKWLKIDAENKGETERTSVTFFVQANTLENGLKTARIRAKGLLDKVTDLSVSELKPKGAEEHAGQTHIKGTEGPAE